MDILHNNDCMSIVDRCFSIKCPHCGTQSNLSAVSIPRYEMLVRYKPERVVIGYRCDSCNDAVCLRFKTGYFAVASGKINISENYEEIENASVSFEFSFLPEGIRDDFKEALTAYTCGCYNAFAAMCRRTIQSTATDLGATGKDKVKRQLYDLKEIAQIDDELFDVLNQIIVDGHDGAHPHLPPIDKERAEVLLLLMEDVMHQLYVRKGQLQKAEILRQQAIKAKKEP
ncbi:MAG: hypothetical protein DCF15_09455 [Phormidesmis priestleyi]|uniref:DUF4145 domain-containing protein n=1 Tax=Phormidesmis priestleyi TaxID=268141 RepID=A0A2W4XP02_9CYAN|nr:MAG: hypothetical protein DCF15_09455 [Phormidesmis priestleyi]